MKYTALTVSIALAGMVYGMASQADNVDQEALKAEAAGIVKQFGGTLKPELKKALQEGGPAHAISVCSEKAPEIASKLSTDTGWSVKRVSLKERNAESATPDDWERKVLEQFDARQAAGEAAMLMAYSEVVDGQYRFMKAQGVEKVCMNCHAADIKPETEAALKEYYPNDKARGYTMGQVRGAFSLSKPL